MQHSDDGGERGIIDKGDVVYCEEVNDRKDIITYFMGKRNNYEKYGEYGDVIAYYKNGYNGTAPVIHRPIIWIEYNESGNSFDIPELQYHEYGEDGEWYTTGNGNRWHNLSDMVVLKDVGHDHLEVSLRLRYILSYFENWEIEPHSGFITLGDNNGANYDQLMLRDDHGGIVRPVKGEWIIGKVNYLVDK